jgi:transposase
VSAPVPGCPGCESLQARLREAEAALSAQQAAFEAQLAVVRSQFEALQAEVLRLQAQIAELNAQLSRNSGNSSNPPSSDPPDVRAQRPQPPRSGRKRGAQRGHRGRHRCSFPPDVVDETFECLPRCCGHCGTTLRSEAGPEDPPPLVHQVADLPEKLKLVVHEYHLHARGCPRCGKRTWAMLPAGVPRGNWGAGVQALAALLVGYFRLSRRRVHEFLSTLFGAAPCVGTVVALEAATVEALRPAVAEAVAAVQQAEAVNSDET